MTTQALDFNIDLPLLTEIISDSDSDNFPILTDIVAEPMAASELPAKLIPTSIASDAQQTQTLSAGEMQQLLLHIETHLETVFTSKLNSQLERLQHLAVDLAITELKAELPQLLRDALTTTVINR